MPQRRNRATGIRRRLRSQTTMKLTPVIIACLYATFSMRVQAEPITATSSTHGTQLIELYTSQGCSSCPPAERWMSELATHPDLWTRYVPVVFHVDYWDRLGWKDPFASSTYTRRQYAYAAYHRMRSVYTPGFFINGKEWKGFFDRKDLPAADTLRNQLSGTWKNGKISINLLSRTNKSMSHAAILGFGSQTYVRRGENAGRRLTSDFVVLAYKKTRSKAKSPTMASIEFDMTKLATESSRLAFAIWSTEGSSPLPTAAAGAWFPKNSRKIK